MKVGDVVQLRSGGPRMTVAVVKERQDLNCVPRREARCSWIYEGEARSEDFYVEQLRVVVSA